MGGHTEAAAVHVHTGADPGATARGRIVAALGVAAHVRIEAFPSVAALGHTVAAAVPGHTVAAAVPGHTGVVLDAVVSGHRKELVVSVPISFLGPSMAGVVCDQYRMADPLCGSLICILAERALAAVALAEEGAGTLVGYL